jgi:hypothetical protein
VDSSVAWPEDPALLAPITRMLAAGFGSTPDEPPSTSGDETQEDQQGLLFILYKADIRGRAWH